MAHTMKQSRSIGTAPKEAQCYTTRQRFRSAVILCQQCSNFKKLINKSAILNIFKELKKIISKELKDSMRMLSHQIENVNRQKL